MTLTPRSIHGSMLFTASPATDARGRFGLIWDLEAFRAAGIAFAPTSACQSYNQATGTLRGMHYQAEPHGQSKLVTCSHGAILDVIVDLRPDSPSYLAWESIALHEADGISLFIPRGCAHGFLTREPRSTITYLLDGEYRPGSGRVLRWNDPAVGIAWPCTDPILSEKDRHAADFVL